MPARQRLRLLWAGLRLCAFAFSIAYILLMVSYTYWGANATPTFRHDDFKTGYLFSSISNFLLAVVPTPANRGRFLRRLGELVNKGENEKTQEQQAAVIAALLGTQDAGTTLASASDHFRSLPLDSLTREELVHNLL